MRQFLRYTGYTFILLLFLLLVGVAAFPTYLSTPSGKQRVLGWVDASSKGKLKIDQLKVSWFGSQRIENLSYHDKKGELLLSFRLFETDTSLFSLLFNRHSFGKTVIEEPYFVYVGKEEEKEKKKEKKRSTSASLERWTPPRFKEGLWVEKGKVLLTQPGIPPITLSEIRVIQNPTTEQLHLQVKAVQGKEEGNITLVADYKPHFHATIHLTDFPLAILDVLSDSSSFTAALGNKLESAIEIDKEGEEAMQINATLKTPYLIAQLDGVSEKKQLIVKPQSYLEYTLTPTLFKRLIDEDQRAHWELASNTTLRFQIEKGVFPLNLKKVDFHALNLQATAHVERAELHHTDVGSYSLKHFNVYVMTQKELEVEYQGEIQGKELTKLQGKVVVSSDGSLSSSYDYQGFPVSLLALVSTGLEKNVRLLFGSQFNLLGNVAYHKGDVEGKVALSSADTTLEGELKGDLSELDFEVIGHRKIGGAPAKVIGESLDMNLRGVALFQDKNFAIPTLKGELYNPHFELSLRGNLGNESTPFSLEQIHLNASGRIKSLPGEGAPLNGSTLSIQVDGAENLLVAKAEAKNMRAHAEVSHFIQQGELLFEEADYSFSGSFSKFPVGVISPFLSDNFDLTLLVGKHLQLQTSGSYHPTQTPLFTMDLKAQGEGVVADLSLALDGTLQVADRAPSTIQWRMTPERYKTLVDLLSLEKEAKPLFMLEHPTMVNLTISQFQCPTSSPKHLGYFLCESGFTGQLEMGPMLFHNRETNESLLFEKISGMISGENFSQSINLNLAGQLSANNIPEGEKSAIDFKGEVLRLWTPTGTLNREGMTLKGVLTLDVIPVRQLTGLVPMDDESRQIVQAVLGELVNARVEGSVSQLEGPVTVDIQSSNFKAVFPLQLHPHAITLRGSVDAEITLTEAVNTTLLSDIMPLLLTGAYSEHPLKLSIAADGFLIPIRPYTLQGVKVGKAVFDIGKITVRNGGQIQQLMSFLKTKEQTTEGWMTAWFTPIYIHLENGVSSYKRVDALLAGNVHIALWGSVNLVNEQVRMVLAISADTLKKQFGLKDLSPNEMFQVKMRGTTHKLELDWSAASTRIGFIVARAAGGQLGNIIGGILEQIVKAFGEEPTPPPTTSPFPWEKH